MACSLICTVPKCHLPADEDGDPAWICEEFLDDEYCDNPAKVHIQHADDPDGTLLCKDHLPLDADGCFTLPNGECISPGPCIHTPKPCKCGGFIDLNVHYDLACKGEAA